MMVRLHLNCQKDLLLPPSLFAMDLPGGRTQIFNVRRIWGINHHPVETDKNSASESISDTEDWLNWNGDLDNANDSEDNRMADIESDMEQVNSIENPQSPEQRNVNATPNVPRLILPTWKWKKQAAMVLVAVNAIKTRRNQGVKKKLDRIRQCFTCFIMYLD